MAEKPAVDRIEKGLWWDRPWKLVEGCSPVSEGCQNCWSAREAHMRSKQKNEKIRAQYEGLTTPEGRWNGRIRLLEKNLNLPLRVKKPTVFAVWNDLLHPDVPFDFFLEAINMMREARQHTYLILTKRPEILLKYIRNIEDWYASEAPHIWFGTTAENQKMANERIPILLRVPAEVRFVSVEPMLAPVDLTNVQFTRYARMDVLDGCGINELSPAQSIPNAFCSRLDWVICGGESGPHRRTTDIDAIRHLRDQCVAAGVPFFLKQMDVAGKLVKMPELDGQRWAQWPEATS